MKKILEIWWKKGSKVFSIINYKRAWKRVGNKPRLDLYTNGAKRKNGDTCFDCNFIIGYTIISYTNFDLQRGKKNDR